MWPDCCEPPDAAAGEALRLLNAVDADHWGDVGPTVYETARVAALAPWLPGQSQRIAYLLRGQAADGTWGEGPWSYRLIPTLSAIDAALAVLRMDGQLSPANRERLASAAAAGLAAVRTSSSAGPRPDTVAGEIIVPGLIQHINRQLDQPEPADLPALGPWHRGPRVQVPAGYDPAMPDRLRKRLENTGSLPVKLHHTFEAVAEYCPVAARPVPAGLLGSSPGATAAWIARAPATAAGAAARELEATAARYGWLVPETAPVTAFERLLVLSAMVRAGLPPGFLPTARSWVAGIYDRHGARGAPGVAPDADDTALAIHISAALGDSRDPAPLDQFETATHFACYLGEDTGSVSANAHVLHALISDSHQRSDNARAGAIAKVRDWLLDQQAADGYWTDKWHASPYYATAQCVAALAAHSHGQNRAALAMAACWVEQTQRADGSWGHWSGTAEETAYAAQILLSRASSADRPALADAHTFLTGFRQDRHHQHPAMWHDKTLYAPAAIIEAEVITTSSLLATALTDSKVGR